jgi:hypothetical protein
VRHVEAGAAVHDGVEELRIADAGDAEHDVVVALITLEQDSDHPAAAGVEAEVAAQLILPDPAVGGDGHAAVHDDAVGADADRVSADASVHVHVEMRVDRDVDDGNDGVVGAVAAVEIQGDVAVEFIGLRLDLGVADRDVKSVVSQPAEDVEANEVAGSIWFVPTSDGAAAGARFTSARRPVKMSLPAPRSARSSKGS